MPAITRIIPILVYEDILAAHNYLVDTFGFTAGGVARDGEGNSVHAEVRAGEYVIWLHRAAAEQELASPRLASVANAGLVVHVANVDAHYQHAVACGANPDNEPRDMPYGQREYGVKDLEGHRWWFATPLQ